MILLGIETSCDETAAAIVEDGIAVKSSIVASQMAQHAPYGGVVPELAAREHVRNIMPVVAAALVQGGVSVVDLDGIAVTCKPGLVPALLVGLSFAQGIAAAGSLPIVGVNHVLGHIYSCFMAEPELLDSERGFPILALVVSGGHTSLILIRADGTASVLGGTLDDAAGEAFDKAAKILDLGYPGGPVIERLAEKGDPHAIRFPRGLTGEGGKPMRAEDRFNFSFSGLKTSLLYRVRDRHRTPDTTADIAAGYQAAVVEVLVRKTMDAADAFEAPTVLACGGVACNGRLRSDLEQAAAAANRRVVIAPPAYCTDNAAMIAGIGYHYLEKGEIVDPHIGVGARLEDDVGELPFAPHARRRKTGRTDDPILS